ncbi:TetR/AcrR family transcriptional regulator [Novosphingobium sp. G106]|uniref:TetR/AcrR family transcriptional regulator n=1 Tax=Novosphingobium sp. G106 TaxID=2849500 RepID=UPI001C2D436F|nr:TetR/AcrR family transcriptional regulator [Novosphingobium sp. G106]MBV1691891.1 TetR/AcrR family transcriptional regulator [Novosphingobium sp. G106]
MMVERGRTRRDPRREVTRTALIEKAEALIAERGLDGVSPRQIGAAIGSANNNVVAYHFGGMEELISAIYHHRLPGIEARRAELIAELDALGRGAELRGLMDALWRPLYEQRGEDGKHSYVAFLAGLARSGWAWTRYTLHEEYPVVMVIVERIRPLLPVSARPKFHQRLIVTAAMISNSLAAMNQFTDKGASADAVFADLVAMATAALLCESDVA